jgi:hypothetical protein
MADNVSRRFEDVSRVLEDLDIDRAWTAATESERRILIEELVENVTVLPDHLDVTVSGAPRLHVRYQEVGLKESGPDRVEGGEETMPFAHSTPRQRGDRPTSERESMAIRSARWEPPTFGCQPPD